jgi:hypothetical protein
MEKRGQVTIFIILAIIIVASIILFFVFRGKTSLNGRVNPEVVPISNYITDCIKQTARYGLYEIGAKGGYYFPPKESLDTGEAYYVLNKKNLIPNNTKIESQIDAYIKVNLRSCTNGFIKFPTFNITEREISAKTSLKNDRISLDVNYPISIKKSGYTYALSDFKNIEVLTHADLLYNIAANYSNIFIKNGGLSLTYASDIEDSFNIITTFQHFPNYTLVTLTDAKGIGANSTYQWRFILQ